MHCINCGKEIEDNSNFCPECGAPQQGTTSQSAPNAGNYANPINQPTAKKAPYNTMCILGLVISGISLLINFFGLVGIAGTIVSIVGFKSCKQKNENGEELAIIGTAIGVLSIFYGFITILYL